MKSMNQLKRAVKIFYCYAHEDKPHLRMLQKHLSPLLRQNIISEWYDGDIIAGEQWEQEIKKHLNEAQIILLLISPDFISSDYCHSTEMQQSLERHKRGEAKVISLIIRPTADWKSISYGDIRLGSLQAFPTDTKPVTAWTNRDKAWENVAKGIKEAINELLRDVPVPPVSNGQKQVSMGYQPIVSPPIKGPATSQGFATRPDGSWGNRAKGLVAAITLVLVISIAALVVINLPHDPPSPNGTSTPTPALSDAQSPKVTSTPTPALSGATITFNALGVGTNVIYVYPGVDDTPQDKKPNGTYYSGNTVSIVCEKTGRTVTSNTAANEPYRQSNVWYKLQTPPGAQPMYATDVYADKHGSVPQC